MSLSGTPTEFNRPSLMGILNVTPDSFSDGGSHVDPALALAHAEALIGAGADLVDVGGESTRPGAEPVALEVELGRVVPVVELLGAAGIPFSIDTRRAAVAEAALAAGACMVNDVSALRADPEMSSLVAGAGAAICLMHMLGEPATMQAAPEYDDVVLEVRTFLEQRMEAAARAGIAEHRIWLDPGIGFGKTLGHNLELLAGLDQLTSLGQPLVFGASRKSFLGKLTGKPPSELEAATAAANLIAYQRGASMFRVHRIGPTRDALRVAAATLDVQHGRPTNQAPEGGSAA